MKGMLRILKITKKQGKILNQIIPQYIFTGLHKRNYYITECEKAMKELKKITTKGR